MTTITIPSRFNGPPGSGNGGYTCGVIAGVVGPGAEVTLRHPPPLDTPMVIAEAGGVWEVHHDGTLIAEATVVEWEFEVPPPPSLEEAGDAATRYAGFDHHEFPTCFTCGVDRDDGLAIWPGRVAGSDMVAAPWTSPDDLATLDGTLAPELVWAALDCPGAWVAARDMAVEPIVLGRMAARTVTPLPVEGVYVSYAWSLGEDGRKSYAGTAIADASGGVVAYARQTWIAIR